MALKAVNVGVANNENSKVSELSVAKSYRFPVEFIQRFEEYRFKHRYKSNTALIMFAVEELMKNKP